MWCTMYTAHYNSTYGRPANKTTLRQSCVSAVVYNELYIRCNFVFGIKKNNRKNR